MKKTIEIRLRIKVEYDSSEAVLVEYLRDVEATPYPFREMVMLALKTFWLPYAYKHLKVTSEQLHQVTLESIYGLLIHLQRLQSMIGIKLDSGMIGSILPIQVNTASVSISASEAVHNSDNSLTEELSVEEADDGEWNVPFQFTSNLGDDDYVSTIAAKD
ncbi:MAG: hypothetical protein JO235_18310 [Chroococcidiopsidaceae cyanobacterium CP_BM_RX_35]|nr:hypothetical protein [Chroococcidiopsidaceae cyanobacterium CP_BM_RX_35]